LTNNNIFRKFLSRSKYSLDEIDISKTSLSKNFQSFKTLAINFSFLHSNRATHRSNNIVLLRRRLDFSFITFRKSFFFLFNTFNCLLLFCFFIWNIHSLRNSLLSFLIFIWACIWSKLRRFYGRWLLGFKLCLRIRVWKSPIFEINPNNFCNNNLCCWTLSWL